jgi:hypothetical protein
MKHRGTASRPKRHRSRAPLIQERRSGRTNAVYLYGDFRQYADVGGRVEPLREAGSRTATSSSTVAARLYADRIEHYASLRNAAVVMAPGAQPVEPHPSGQTGDATGVVPSRDPRRMRLCAMITLHLERKSLLLAPA